MTIVIMKKRKSEIFVSEEYSENHHLVILKFNLDCFIEKISRLNFACMHFSD